MRIDTTETLTNRELVDAAIELAGEFYKPRLGHDIDGVRAVMIPDDEGEWVSRSEAEHIAEQLKLAQCRIAELENDEVHQRLANAEHQLYMAELAKHNLKASRKAQFRKRLAAEKRTAELERERDAMEAVALAMRDDMRQVRQWPEPKDGEPRQHIKPASPKQEPPAKK